MNYNKYEKNPALKRSTLSSIDFLAEPHEVEQEIKEEITQDNTTHKFKISAVYHVMMLLISNIGLRLFILDVKTPLHIAINLPHNIFFWTMDAWSERFQYGSAWLEQLPGLVSNGWLERRKEQVSLRQLKDLILSLVISYIDKKRKEDAYKMLKSVQECQNLEERLSVELKENTSKFHNIRHERKVFEQCVQCILRIKQMYSRKNLEQILILKMKDRYNTAYNQTVEEQAILQCAHAESKLRKEIEHTNKNIENDDYISVCRRDVYHNNIEILRKEIEELQERFSNEQVKLNNQSQLLRNQMQKMKTNATYYKEKLQLYRTAVGAFQAGEINDFRELRNMLQTLANKKAILTADKSLDPDFELKREKSMHQLGRATSRKSIKSINY